MSLPQPIVHLVDDDDSFLRATSRLLRAKGFVVNTFSSAADLFSNRDQEASGCLVADLQISQNSETEAKMAIRDSPFTEEVPDSCAAALGVSIG